MRNANSLLSILILSGLIAPLEAQDASSGASMSVGVVTVQATQATARIPSQIGTQFAVAVPTSRTRAWVLLLGTRTGDLEDDTAHSMSVLEAGVAYRQRMAGGKYPQSAAMWLTTSGGMARFRLGRQAHTYPWVQGGVIVDMPVRGSVGAELHLLANAEGRQARHAEIAPVNPTDTKWALGVRIGLALRLRQSLQPRRIPVSALPDVTEIPLSPKTYQARLEAVDSAVQEQVRQTQSTAATDPDGRSGDPVASPYLERLPAKPDSLVTARPGRGNGRGTVIRSEDSVVVMAAGAPAAPSVTASTASPQRTIPPVIEDSAPTVLPAAAPRVTPPPVSAAPKDSVELFRDATGVYLSILPTLAEGRISAETKENLAKLIDSQRAAATPTLYTLVVAAPKASAAGERLLDEAIALRQWLVQQGVPNGQVALRTTEGADAGLRIVMYGQTKKASR